MNIQPDPSAPPPAVVHDPSAPVVQMSLMDALEHAQVLQRTENIAAAELVYLEILAQVPDEPNALNFLGILRHQQGRVDEAIGLLRRVIELAPDNVGPVVNLGNVLVEAERFEEAVEVLRRAAEMDPGSPMIFNNFGVAALRCGDHERSEQAFKEGLRLAPERSDLHFNYGRLLYQTGRFKESAAHSVMAIAADPRLTSSRKLLTLSYSMLGDVDRAKQALNDWKAQEPDNPEVEHHLAALGLTDVPDRAPDQYVQRVFDDFAGSFDRKLELLGYRAPRLVTDALIDVAPRLGVGGVVMLDAGCGTGLCGPLLRPFAKRLEGVDLSAGMLDKARARVEYDLLVQAELTAFLGSKPDAYDVIVSADTLCYFGELGEVLAAAARALTGPAVFIFSVEALLDQDAPHRLNFHGRYSHAKRYLEQALQSAGFQIEAIAQHVLRVEMNEPVQGYIVTATRGGAPT